MVSLQNNNSSGEQKAFRFITTPLFPEDLSSEWELSFKLSSNGFSSIFEKK
jgi:hypothetical protein